MSNNFIWSIDRTLSGATTPGPEWTWERWQWRGTPHSQSSSVTGTSPFDCLVSYPENSLGKSYSSAEIQLVYSTAPVDWATTTPGQSGCRSNGNEGELRNQSLAIRCSLVSYQGHPLGLTPLQRMQSVYFKSHQQGCYWVYLFNGISTPYGLFNLICF